MMKKIKTAFLIACFCSTAAAPFCSMAITSAKAYTIEEINLSDYYAPEDNWDYTIPDNANAAKITPSPWAQNSVDTAVALNLAPTFLLSNFTDNITRGEFCALAVQLYEISTKGAITERMDFKDTTDINVMKMGGLGIISGVGDGNFAPDQPLTREQAAIILSNLYEQLSKTEIDGGIIDFSDAGQISSWARVGVGKAVQAGIMNGVGNNAFAPGQNYTREQSIITMVNIYNALNQ